MSSIEQTLSIIKPDGVERNLVDTIKKKFIEEKLKIVKIKKIQISKDEASEFYKVHQTKPFFDRLCSYLSSGPIVVMILEGNDAIAQNRRIFKGKLFLFLSSIKKTGRSKSNSSKVVVLCELH